MIDPKSINLGDRVDTVGGLGVVTEIHSHGIKVALDDGSQMMCQFNHVRKCNDGDTHKSFDGVRAIRIESNGDSPDIPLKITIPAPIGGLSHEPTMTMITVYSKIGWFKRLMLKWCFGLEYVKHSK